MKRINWDRVWREFVAYCDEMEFTFQRSNMWLYCKDTIEVLVNAELSEAKKGAKKCRARRSRNS